MTDFFDTGTIGTRDLLINLVIGAILSFALALYYIKFARTFSNRAHLARMMPLMTLTTLLVISVVKSSLALSLGLVGALSIVRFRTPIKEPEELAYLFLAIAVGLGLGADQRLATILAVAVILPVMLIPYYMASRSSRRNTFMQIEIPDSVHPREEFEQVVTQLAQHVRSADLRRMDLSGQTLNATLSVSTRSDKDIAALMEGMRQHYPNASITFVEQDAGFQV